MMQPGLRSLAESEAHSLQKGRESSSDCSAETTFTSAVPLNPIFAMEKQIAGSSSELTLKSMVPARPTFEISSQDEAAVPKTGLTKCFSFERLAEVQSPVKVPERSQSSIAALCEAVGLPACHLPASDCRLNRAQI